VITDPPVVLLPTRSSVRECAALKQQLLALVAYPEAVRIDVTDVELIDTAALQLLFAFCRERIAKDLSTIWQGDSPAFRAAATAVSLQVGDSAGPSSHSACQHDA